jgi:hypothetical protein
VHGELARAYAELLRRARERREVENQQFAERLAAWNAAPAAEPELLPVERALELLVAPGGRTRGRCSCLLLDGLDLGVWRLLHADLAARGWTWWQPQAAAVAPVAVATLPSVTSASARLAVRGGAEGGQTVDREAGLRGAPRAPSERRRRAGAGALPQGRARTGNALAPRSGAPSATGSSGWIGA